MAIEFNSLTRDNNFAIADVTSIRDLVDNLDFLTARVTDRTKRAMQQRLNENISTQNAMAIIERLIAYESIVVDAIGAESIQITDVPAELPYLDLISIPDNVYNDAANVVHGLETEAIYRRIQKNASQFNLVSPYESYYDQLERRGILVSTIADTGATLPRVLFYMVLSNFCNAPLFLNPNKDRYLSYISDQCVRDMLKVIEDETDRLLIGDANDISKSGISLPPLAEYVFQTAAEKGTSISASMMDIRESKDARSFRSWLHSIQLCLNDGSRQGLHEGTKQLTDLRNTVENWARHMDIGLDVTHKYTAFGVGICTDVIKKITAIELKIPDISFKVKDPILNPKRHFKFIASWHRG